MPKVHHVKKARKDIPDCDIKAGDEYYWWKFRFGGKRCSKTRPRQSQLTQSEYLSSIYSIQESAGDSLPDLDDIQAEIDAIVSELEEVRDQCEERRNNMPDSLQDSDSGNIPQERYDGVDSVISELESIDTDADDKPEREDGDTQTEEEYADAVQEYLDSRRDDIWQEVCSALDNLPT